MSVKDSRKLYAAFLCPTYFGDFCFIYFYPKIQWCPQPTNDPLTKVLIDLSPWADERGWEGKHGLILKPAWYHENLKYHVVRMVCYHFLLVTTTYLCTMIENCDKNLARNHRNMAALQFESEYAALRYMQAYNSLNHLVFKTFLENERNYFPTSSLTPPPSNHPPPALSPPLIV